MNIHQLLAGLELPAGVSTAIRALIERKQTVPELGLGPRIAEIDDWLHARLASLDPTDLGLPDQDRTVNVNEADELFRTTVRSRWPRPRGQA